MTTRLILAMLALCLAPPATAQVRLVPSAVYGADGSVLHGVVAGDARSEAVAALTPPAPAVHLFSPDRGLAWGREGGGPADLASPVDLSWTEDAIHVLDIGNRKLVRFDERGEFITTRGLGDVWARSVDIVGPDTIVGVFVPMGRSRAVVRLRGEEADTLLDFEILGEQVRLQASGAPSLTVPLPFSPQVVWSAAADGGVLWFDPDRGEVVFQGRDGSVERRATVSWEGMPVSEADREWWIANRIPREFMGQRVFEPLRRVARAELTFPERHSPVLDLEANPGGGVWVKRAIESSGQVWTLLDEEGSRRGDFRLEPGRRVIAVSESHVFALATSDLGEETIEAFVKPGWAR